MTSTNKRDTTRRRIKTHVSHEGGIGWTHAWFALLRSGFEYTEMKNKYIQGMRKKGENPYYLTKLIGILPMF